jgi:hypothetical protein
VASSAAQGNNGSKNSRRLGWSAGGAVKHFKTPYETILRNPGNRPETNGGYTCIQQSGDERRQEASMNHSIHSADRATHLKIVVVALVAGILVAGFGISARTSSDYSQTAHVIKAGKPVVVTSSDASIVR